LRAGGDIALIAWIRLGHSVLMVVTTQLQPQPSPPTHLRSGRSNEEWIRRCQWNQRPKKRPKRLRIRVSTTESTIDVTIGK
jgi:hypothetical protein